MLLSAFLFAIALLLMSAGSARAQECLSAACLSTTAHLAEVDSTQSELLDPLLGALLGEDAALGLSVAEYDALADLDVRLGDLLAQLQLELEVATPEEVLAANLTLPELIDALDAILPDNIGIDALQALPDVAGDIVLGDLLQLSASPDSLADLSLNLLDLVVGSIQLFNHSNAVAIHAVALDGAALTALGLPAQGIDGVTLRASVLEPPQIACGPTGTHVRSASIRIAIDASLAATGVALTPISFSLAPAAAVTATTTITLADLSIYLDVASGDAILQAVDALAPSATVSATPGIANLYVGATASIDDFFAADFDPATDLLSATVGAIGVNAEVCVATVCNTSTYGGAIRARTFAQGDSGSQSFTFTGPFPQMHSFESSGSALATLVAEALANLDVAIDLGLLTGAPVAGLLDALLGEVLAPATDAIGSDLIEEDLTVLLADVADPLLGTLGVGLGKMHVTIFGANGDDVFQICSPPGDSDGDGIPDDVECPDGVENCPDTDGDGLPDHQDVDDDGDGIYTRVECPLGIPCPDSDGDGTPDYLDPDDDGDGVYTVIECPAGRTSSASPACPDTDGDGTVDYLDTDDDNDGLTTRVECPAGRTSAASPLCPDSDGDGIPDYLDAVDDRIPPDQDTDGDGVPDQHECPNGIATCPDTDGDGVPDHEDADDDGDGVGTIVECPGGPPCPDTDGDGLPDYRDPDDDGDGVYTIVECPGGRPTNAAPPCLNTDGDANPNYLDTDDDDDGALTEIECPDGRVSLEAPRCPAIGNPDIEDYLNPDFVLYGVQFAPVIFRSEQLGPAGE